MSETYPVSVIIPVHNAVNTVERAIESAFAAGAAQVVVVDDASDDGSWELIADLIPKFGHEIDSEQYMILRPVAYVTGVCQTRNYGIHRARHNFIVPLDADDAFTPNGIQLLYEHAAPGTVVYGGHIKAETGEVVSAPPPERLVIKNLTGATFGFWRRDWEDAGGYHPDFNLGCEDWALMCALVQSGCKLVRVDEPVYIYSPGGARAKRCVKYAEALRQLLHEHYPTVFSDAQQGR